MKLPSLVAGAHPSVSVGFTVEPATGDGPAYLVASCFLFHVKFPIPFT